jgi:RNA polymerase sigma factor (sigma-70 family)
MPNSIMNERQSTEEELALLKAIEQLRSGDSKAFDVIYRLCFDRVEAYCRCKICSKDRQMRYEEDLASEIMIELWKTLRESKTEWNSPQQLWQAINRLVFERAIDHARKSKRQKRRSVFEWPDLSQESSKQQNDIAEMDANESLEYFCEQLDSRRHLEYVECKWSGMTNEEIAELWQVHVRSVRRTMLELRSAFEEYSSSHISPARAKHQ